MSNITKNHKVSIFAIFLASALMLGTFSVAGVGSVFADPDNDVDQELEQESSSEQDSQCVTGLISLVDCNNVACTIER